MIIPGLIVGLAIGIVSGALLVPALVCGFGMSQHDAQRTSLATHSCP